MNRSLGPATLQEIGKRLQPAHAAFARRYPGESGHRQPVHTVYGGAHLFHADLARKLGNLALHSMDEFAPNFSSFAKAMGLHGADALPDSAEDVVALEARWQADAQTLRHENKAAWLACTVHHRVREKLRREPVEDFRIDFEDGYGYRPDEKEDSHAVAAAGEVAAALNSGALPVFTGIRIKPFSEELRERSMRTCDIFLTELGSKTRAGLPAYFVVTLPKVCLPDEVAALADVLARLEPAIGFEPGALRMELMIETPQAIVNERGEVNLLHLVSAARGRCVAAHFGAYDYTAGCGITAAHQTITHPACDFARQTMKVALAGSGIWIADSPTMLLPVPPFRAEKNGVPLTALQLAENRATVHRA